MNTTTIEAVTGLVDALAWPLVAVVLLLYIGRSLQQFLRSASEFTIKASGFEATAKRQLAVAASLGAAQARRSANAPSPDDAEEVAEDIAQTVSRAMSARTVRCLDEASVLWVDDRPENNAFERRALFQAGMNVVTAKSTAEGLERAQRGSFDAIITDMGRPPDDRAGFTLLRELRDSGIPTPVIVYSGSGSRMEHQAEARASGAFGSTQHPQELLRLTIAAIGEDHR